MPPRAKRLTALPDDELEELLQLTKDADSVELKLTVPEEDQRATVASLGIDPLDAQVRQVFFFDTPDLTLNRAGVVARARRVQGKSGDSVVKLRPVVPDQLPKGRRRSPNLGIEVDAMPSGYVCSASVKGRLDNALVRDVVTGQRGLKKLFSKEQRAFFEAYAPEGVGLDALTMLGPIFVLKVNFVPEDLDRKVVAELWLYPDGGRILELSTKCAPSEMFQAATETRAYLTKRGVDLTGEQQTKTKTALEFFAGEAVRTAPA